MLIKDVPATSPPTVGGGDGDPRESFTLDDSVGGGEYPGEGGVSGSRPAAASRRPRQLRNLPWTPWFSLPAAVPATEFFPDDGRFTPFRDASPEHFLSPGNRRLASSPGSSLCLSIEARRQRPSPRAAAQDSRDRGAGPLACTAGPFRRPSAFRLSAFRAVFRLDPGARSPRRESCASSSSTSTCAEPQTREFWTAPDAQQGVNRPPGRRTSSRGRAPRAFHEDPIRAGVFRLEWICSRVRGGEER